MADDAFSPFLPIRTAQVKERRRRIKQLFKDAQLPCDDITVEALVVVLHDAADFVKVPVVMVIKALAALDGATINVAVKVPDEDEDEHLIGTPVVN